VANLEKDQIDSLISIPPQKSVGKVFRFVKTNTARNIKKKFPELKKYYWSTDNLWSDGYFVSLYYFDSFALGYFVCCKILVNLAAIDFTLSVKLRR